MLSRLGLSISFCHLQIPATPLRLDSIRIPTYVIGNVSPRSPCHPRRLRTLTLSTPRPKHIIFHRYLCCRSLIPDSIRFCSLTFCLICRRRHIPPLLHAFFSFLFLNCWLVEIVALHYYCSGYCLSDYRYFGGHDFSATHLLEYVQ